MPRQAQGWRPTGATLDALGIAGLVGIGWLVTHTNEDTFSIYRWGLLLLSICTAGLLLLSICTAALLAAVSHPQTLLARSFGMPPLRWLGERSYGLYLWHLPVIVCTPAVVLATHPAERDLTQVLITVGLAALSWYYIEDPIRTRGLLGAVRATRDATAPVATSPVRLHSSSVVVGASLLFRSRCWHCCCPVRCPTNSLPWRRRPRHLPPPRQPRSTPKLDSHRRPSRAAACSARRARA